ncbi:MAG: 3-methyl-2-oxobutanoate hydroxymethyltransferase [Syntrophales bacterium]|nr:3-methyl-2-oxobutanoate hydroxymethyltransferase [Syntrophales bacterium]
MKKDLNYFKEKKQKCEKSSMLTCYDYPMAVLMEKAGIDSILVGDSVGTNILGYDSELQVTMDDMIHHLRAVKRGITDAYLIGDMPYASYDRIDSALANARRFIDNGADAVKLEGLHYDVIAALAAEGIEAIAHIGLNPQLSTQKRAFGKKFDEAVVLIEGARRLEAAGAAMILLEKIPERIAAIITREAGVPTVGIGAGKSCDLQVLVVNDIIGFAPKPFKHIKVYDDVRSRLLRAVAEFREEVASGAFPSWEHTNLIPDEEYEKISDWISASR